MSQNFRSSPIQLSEAVEGKQFPEEVQLLKVGTFTDPRYGKFSVTTKMLGEMVSNFKKGIRGLKPAIDFKHESDAEAAAWMKDLFLKDGGNTLWCVPDWTGEGQRKLSDRVYGYLSADFSQNYRDNEKGELHGCVLLGAALTNRPVIKNMKPVIQLSEGDSMFNPEDLEKLAAMMQEMGITDINALMAKIAEMKLALPAKEEAVKEVEKKDVELKEASKQLSEKSIKLSEAQARINVLESEKATSEKEKVFNLMLAEGKAIPAQKDSYLAGDVVKFAELAPKGGVKITEKGSEAGADDSVDEEDKILKLAEEKVKNKEAKDIGTAISMVMKEQKESK